MCCNHRIVACDLKLLTQIHFVCQFFVVFSNAWRKRTLLNSRVTIQISYNVQQMVQLNPFRGIYEEVVKVMAVHVSALIYMCVCVKEHQQQMVIENDACYRNDMV